MKFQSSSSLVFAAAVAMSAACGDQGSTFVDASPHDHADASVDGSGTPQDGGDTDAATSIDAASPDAMTSTPDAMTSTPDASTQNAMWRGAQMIENLDSAYQPVVDMDGVGRAIVVWENGVPDPGDDTREYGEIRVVRFDPASGWSDTVALSPPPTPDLNAHNFDLSVNAMGDAMVIWNQREGIDQDTWVRRFSPAGGWEPAVRLYEGASQAQASGVPRIALADDGTAVALFSKRGGDVGLDSQIHSRYFTPSTGWGPLTPVHIVASGDTLPDDIAMDSSGRAVAVWTLHQGGSTVWGSRFSAATGWTAPVELGAEAQDQGWDESDDPRVAVDPAGNAVVVFEATAQSSTVWAVIGSADGSWQPATRLEDASRYANLPAVAVDAMGRATVVWQSWPTDQPSQLDIRARRFTPGSGWSAIEALESSPSSMSNPCVAMTVMGTATAAWKQEDVGILAARFVPGSGWSAPVQISNTTMGNYISPVIAGGGLESFVAVWPHEANPVENNPSPKHLWANVYR